MAAKRKPKADKGLPEAVAPGYDAPESPERHHRRPTPSRTTLRKSRKKQSYISVADSYAAEALVGNVGKRVKEMARRYLAEREHGSGVTWDAERLDRLVAWSGNLPTVNGPMEWEPWAVWVMAMLVARRGPDGLPLTREMILQVPRGCGKTQYASVLAGWTLDNAEQEGRVGCEVIVLATMLEKAGHVAERLDATPHVRSKTWKYIGRNSNRAKVVQSPAGFIKCCASTPQNADGISPSLIILDEAARMDETYNRAISSMMKVAWSQALIVTTPDVDQYANPYGSMVKVAEDALDRAAELPVGTLAVLFQADDGDDPLAEETWFKANPSLGKRVPVQRYREKAFWATSGDPAQREEFYTQYLSTFTGDLAAAIPPEYYDACVEPWELSSVAGMPAVIGIDFSVGGYSGAQCDLTSMNLSVWDGNVLRSRNWHWWAGRSMEADERRTRMPLRKWHADGLIRSSGPTIDLDAVRVLVSEIAKVVDLKAVVCDPAAGQAGRVAAWERDHGFMVSRGPQNATYMGSAWAIWEESVRAKRIRFHPDPVLRLAIESSRTYSRSGLVIVEKSDHRANNDPLIACMMAIKVMQDREMLHASAYGNDPSRIVI